MSRRLLLGAVAVVVAALAAGGAGGAGGRATVDEGRLVATRAFTVRAEAFALDPAPGVNQTSFAIRPVATRLELANSPASAYGRASVADPGIFELYTGPPPAGTFAECDSSSANIPRQSDVERGGTRLAARCTEQPAGEVLASSSGTSGPGLSAGAQSARSVADGGGESLTVAAEARVGEVVAGPVRIGSARFAGEARANGRPGGAAAQGAITVTDATVAGVPVTIGPSGVGVDRTRVPLELVPAASEAVRQAFTRPGTSEVRLVQPEVVAAPDGTSAEVRGGGLFVSLSNPDPRNNYFLRVTVLGGRVGAATGGLLDAGGTFAPVAVPGGRTAEPAAAPRPAPAAFGGTLGERGEAPASHPAAAPDGRTDGARAIASRRGYDLAEPWPGWWAVLALTALAIAAALPFRRHLAAAWDASAERYFRG